MTDPTAKKLLAAGIILAIAIITALAAAHLAASRYRFEKIGQIGIVRADRWTGRLTLCVVDTGDALSCMPSTEWEVGKLEDLDEAQQNELADRFSRH